MLRQLTIAALLVAAGCAQQDTEAPQSNETASAPADTAAAQSVPALDGQWQVTAIDGTPLAAAMTASFGSGKVSLSAGCLRRAWTYTQKRNVVSFTSDPAGSANCGGGTTGEQETAFAALEQSSIAIFGKDGSEASLSGTGGNLTLQRR
jgi:hypothetical protein